MLLHHITDTLFAFPYYVDPKKENERIFSLLFGGTLVITAFLFLLLIADYVFLANVHILNQLILAAFSVVSVAVIYILWRRRHYWLSARLLVLFYGFISVVIVSLWGTGVPLGILLMGLVIILAGILLGTRYALRVAVISAFGLFLVQFAASEGVYVSHLPSQQSEGSFGEILTYSLLFAMISMIAWLFNRQSERALKKAHRAELALQEEKELLAIRVKERTLELQAAQVEEMQNLYRFAELGQLSTALLHDLANHLTALTLNIDDLQESQYSDSVKRARQNIRYLDSMVSQVREQLEGSRDIKRFNIASKIKDMIRLSQQKAINHNVTIIEPRIINRKPYFVKGDMVRFNQVATILISNAIDSYEGMPQTGERTVKVDLTHDTEAITLTVEDWGKGIPKEKRETIFQPFFSTKEHGMGIGLFIARQTVKKHFGGTLALDSSTDHTRFILELPRQH